MDLRVLKYFVTIAQEESITKASKLLYVSQPTLSRQIKDLEEELGKKLFVRSNYSVKLTKDGFLLRQKAMEILSMVKKTKDELMATDNIDGGEIHIGCPESIGLTSLFKVISDLNHDYPHIKYHIYSAAICEVLDRLANGIIDLAIILQTVDVAKYNFIDLKHADTWGLIMKRDHPLAQKDTISKEDLFDVPLICSRESLKRELHFFFKDDISKIDVIATYDLIFNATLMVRQNLGCILGLKNIINTDDNSDLCFRPLTPALKSSLKLISLPQNQTLRIKGLK